MNFILLAVAVAFAIGCDVYDTTMSEKGIKAGLAVEANYTWIYGTNKPTTFQYYIVNIPIILATAVISLIGVHFHNPVIFYAGLAAPIVLGAKHIQGGLQWRKLGVKW